VPVAAAYAECDAGTKHRRGSPEFPAISGAGGSRVNWPTPRFVVWGRLLKSLRFVTVRIV
jgi:hypothetical protein